MLRRVAVPAVIAVALAACGGGSDESDAVAAPTTAAGTTAAPSPDGTGDTAESTGTTGASGASTGTAESTDAGGAIVPEALQFSAPLVGGGDIEMASLAGRPVLLWFWAPW